MADTKTSALPAGTTPAGTEVLPAVQGGANVRFTVDQIALKSKTLAQLNTQVSDATLIDTGDSRLSDARTPSTHAIAGSEHSASTLANLQTKVSDATLARTDASQTFTGSQQTGITELGKTFSTIDVTPLSNNSLERTMVAAEVLGNPVSATRGMSWIVVIKQDATGGRALTYDTSYVGTGIAVDTSADAANTERVFSCYALSPTKILIVEANGAAV